MYKPALITGALLGALAVILGAMGAHALEKHTTPDVLKIYQKGVEYQFYHVFAILACGILYSAFPVATMRWSFICFLLGVFCFSGSLYYLTYMKINGGGIGGLWWVTPLGGVLFIAGWLLLLFSFFKKS